MIHLNSTLLQGLRLKVLTEATLGSDLDFNYDVFYDWKPYFSPMYQSHVSCYNKCMPESLFLVSHMLFIFKFQPQKAQPEVSPYYDNKTDSKLEKVLRTFSLSITLFMKVPKRFLCKLDDYLMNILFVKPVDSFEVELSFNKANSRLYPISELQKEDPGSIAVTHWDQQTYLNSKIELVCKGFCMEFIIHMSFEKVVRFRPDTQYIS